MRRRQTYHYCGYGGTPVVAHVQSGIVGWADAGVLSRARGTGRAMGNAKETPVKSGRRKGGKNASSSIGNLARDATGWRSDWPQKYPSPDDGRPPPPGIGPMPNTPFTFGPT